MKCDSWDVLVVFILALATPIVVLDLVYESVRGGIVRIFKHKLPRYTEVELEYAFMMRELELDLKQARFVPTVPPFEVGP
jgi:hypothetical protein